jgi:hypothetical protein
MLKKTALVAALLSGLAACGNSNSSEGNSNDGAADDGVTVPLVPHKGIVVDWATTVPPFGDEQTGTDEDAADVGTVIGDEDEGSPVVDAGEDPGTVIGDEDEGSVVVDEDEDVGGDVGEDVGEDPVVVTPPVVVPTTGEARPAASRGAGFFVKNGKVYDKHGVEFVIRGLNHSHAWGHQDNAMRAIPEFTEMGANAVRVVFMPNIGQGTTPAGRRAVVETYLANGLVPIVEDHRTTCSDDPATLRAAVDDWLLPENQAWLKQYEDRVILNIGNEWMNTSWDHDLWVTEYSAAISRLRAAGLHHLIMVDAGGACAQNPRSVRDRGQDIVDADPEHNVMFDVHMYSYWRSDMTGVGAWNDNGLGSPWNIEAELQAIHDRGLALVVGEVGYDTSPQVGYETRPALQTFKDMGIGFLAWSWNSNSDNTLDLSTDNMGWRYDSSADLTAGGRLFIEDPQLGLQATAQSSTAFDP